MAASAASRELFTEAVRAVLHSWPVLQIAVDNGFGGVYGEQKADWMVCDRLLQAFLQWQQGALQPLQHTIHTLTQKKTPRAKVTAPPTHSDEDSDDDTEVRLRRSDSDVSIMAAILKGR
ncbi:Pre-rRNA-processing protein TSR2 [Liparis tanakae]|uniref:Pre-rRNA-processing protein TSR2 homolog n=1 Tax=Liparis tanakae TaxID=230148 RepID=A0A4Z2FW22_9TELE|nr:Pre-rRNA-processing protein TSR2 [Liparis tanakae]